MSSETKFWSLYDAATGIFTGQTMYAHHDKDHDDFIEANLPEGVKAMEGKFDHLSQKVDLNTGQVVAYTPPVNKAKVLEQQRNIMDALLSREIQTLRAIREAILGKPGAVERLQAMDDDIVKLRLMLKLNSFSASEGSKPN